MSNPDQRRHLRYDTDVKVHFYIPYDFRTEVDFSLSEKTPAEKYTGFSRNISAYGMCFESAKDVRPGDHLWLEMHLPDSKEIIFMQGMVRWSQPSAVAPETPRKFLIGVEIRKVEGIDIEQTVYYDQKYSVYWSELLERVIGSFAQMHKEKQVLVILHGILKDADGAYLMLRRSAQCTTWPSTWEFPGGKARQNEHTTPALKRNFREMTALDIRPLQRILDFTYDTAEGPAEYKIFLVEKLSGSPAVSPAHDEIRWCTPEEIKTLNVSPALQQVVEHLKSA